jgi:hypothetical protein
MNKDAVFTLIWWLGVFIIAVTVDAWKKHKQRNRRVSRPRSSQENSQ